MAGCRGRVIDDDGESVDSAQNIMRILAGYDSRSAANPGPATVQVASPEASIVSISAARNLEVSWWRAAALEPLADADGEAADERDDDDFEPEGGGENEANVEVGGQEEEGDQVGSEGQELCKDHDAGPPLDFERDHEQLGQNERREGDGDDAEEGVIEHEDAQQHDHRPLPPRHASADGSVLITRRTESTADALPRVNRKSV
eukprot:353033-Rhodomonas_salina.1